MSHTVYNVTLSSHEDPYEPVWTQTFTSKERADKTESALTAYIDDTANNAGNFFVTSSWVPISDDDDEWFLGKYQNDGFSKTLDGFVENFPNLMETY